MADTHPTEQTLEVRTDTEIADLLEERSKLYHHIELEMDNARRKAGDRRVTDPAGNGVATKWSMTLEEVKASTNPRVVAMLENVALMQAGARRLSNKIATLEQVWADNGYWSRFYIVRNNNGHIHSSMNCVTCFPTTVFGWLPQLSGLTEAEAVAAEGEILCSVCFPSAPSEWTNGKSREAKEAAAEREKAKAERAAKKSAKELEPEDYFDDLWGHSVKTVYYAKEAIRACAEAVVAAESDRPGFNMEMLRDKADRSVMIEELARRALVRKGMTEDELDTMWNRALKKARKNWGVAA